MLLIKHLKSLTNHNKMTKQGTYSPPFIIGKTKSTNFQNEKYKKIAFTHF